MATTKNCLGPIRIQCIIAATIVASWIRQLKAVTLVDSVLKNAFQGYMADFGRTYKKGSGEYHDRLNLYLKRVSEIESHNTQGRSWKMGVNQFTDRTDPERKIVLGWRPTGGTQEDDTGDDVVGAGSLVEEGPHNESVSWQNLITAKSPPNQESCGSCWAFTATALVQTRHEIQTGRVTNPATQELVNCVKNPDGCGGTGGCAGATVELGLDYINKHGIAASKMTPYVGADAICATNSFIDGVSDEGGRISAETLGIGGFKTLRRNVLGDIMTEIQKGPIAISVSGETWFGYSSGVFQGCKTKDQIADHAVLLMGYGIDQEQAGAFAGIPSMQVLTKTLDEPLKYWLIRNSWGPVWGENGFIRMKRLGDQEDRYCGTDFDNQKGTGCKNDPNTVQICGYCGMLYDSVVPMPASPNAPGGQKMNRIRHSAGKRKSEAAEDSDIVGKSPTRNPDDDGTPMMTRQNDATEDDETSEETFHENFENNPRKLVPDDYLEKPINTHKLIRKSS